MTISTVDIRQRLQDAIEAAGQDRAAERALLEQLMVGVQGPKGALVHDHVVGFGSEVTLEDLDAGAHDTHRLMTGEAMDLDAGHISTDSPLGMALLGRREGDVVEVETPRGMRRVRIVGVQTLPAFLDTLDGAPHAAPTRRATEALPSARTGARWRARREPHTGTYG